MNKPAKIAIGFFTFLPLIAFFAIAGYAIFQVVAIMAADDPYMPMMLFSYVGYVIPFLFIFGLFNLALIIFYLVHIGRNEVLDTEKKFLWMVIVISLNSISMPVYWYVHLWNERDGKQDINPDFRHAHEPRGTEPTEF
ncbi:MAG: hypothetical protein PVH63_08410 [Balneolaceae bacterium]|jgi:hypothetical protein